LLVDLMPIGMRDRTQPAHQRQIHAGAHALEDALKQMMVRRYETRIDDAARCVDDLFARLRREVANRRDPSVENANRAGGAHRLLWQASEKPVRVADQPRSHPLAPIWLPCTNPRTPS